MRGSHAENQVATMKRTKSVSKRPRFRDTDQENQICSAGLAPGQLLSNRIPGPAGPAPVMDKHQRRFFASDTPDVEVEAIDVQAAVDEGHVETLSFEIEELLTLVS